MYSVHHCSCIVVFLLCDQRVEMRKKQQGEVIAQLSNALAKAQSALEVRSLFLIDVDFGLGNSRQHVEVSSALAKESGKGMNST